MLSYFQTNLLTLVIKLLLCGGNPAKFHSNYRRYTIPPIPGAKCKILQTNRVKPPKFCSLRRIIGASKANTHTHTKKRPLTFCALQEKEGVVFISWPPFFFFEIGFKRKGLSNIFWKIRQNAAQVRNTCVTVHPLARWYCKNWFAYLHKKNPALLPSRG